MTYKEIGENNQLGIDGFKRFARIVGDVNDEEIRAFMRAAILEVQQQADRALVPCTIEIIGEGSEIQLWQPTIASVVSVTDIDTGDDELADCMVAGQMLQLPYVGRWRVVYKTKPNAYEVEKLRPYVWKLVAAMNEGDTDEEARIKASIPIDYVVH